MLNADSERKVSDLSVEELKNLVSEIVEDSIEKCMVTGTMEGRSKINLKVEGTVIGKMECNFDKKNANYVDDYLVNLKSTWVDSLEVQKKLGHVVSYNVWTAETAGATPNVFLTVRYKNAAAREPNKGRYEAFIKEWRKVLSEKEQRNIASGYDDMREIVDLVVLREVIYN